MDSVEDSSDAGSKHGAMNDLNMKVKLPQVFNPILMRDTSGKYLPDLKNVKMDRKSFSKQKKSVKTTGRNNQLNLRELNYTTSSQGLETLDNAKYLPTEKKGPKAKKAKNLKLKKVKQISPIVVKNRLSPKIQSHGIHM